MVVETFEALFREKVAELEAGDAEATARGDDPVERLALDARHAMLIEGLGAMPRPGHCAYTSSAAVPAEAVPPPHLNILF